MSRPPALEITPELLEEVEGHAARGLTQDQIARNLGIHPATWYANKKKYNELSEAIKKGQAKGIQEISNALFNKALGGDTVAQIFFLKNRDPDNWKDRKEVKNETTVETKRGYSDLTENEKKAVQEVRRKLDESPRVTH